MRIPGISQTDEVSTDKRTGGRRCVLHTVEDGGDQDSSEICLFLEVQVVRDLGRIGVGRPRGCVVGEDGGRGGHLGGGRDGREGGGEAASGLDERKWLGV